MYGINLIAFSKGFYGHLLGRTFIWRYLRSAEVVLVCKTWYRQKTEELLWHLSRDLVQVSHHAQTVTLRVTWILFHEKFELAFIFILFLFLLWVHPMRSILSPTGKTQKKIDVLICEAPGTTSWGRKSDPWGGAEGFTLPRSSREHLRRVQWVTTKVSFELVDLMQSSSC